MTIDDDLVHRVPICLRSRIRVSANSRLSRIRRHAVLQRRKWLASFRNSIERPRQHKDVELRNIRDVLRTQIEPHEDKRDQRRSKDTNELETESSTLCTTDVRR